LFRAVIGVDIPVMIVLLIVVPQLAAGKIVWEITLASMLAAVLPDSIWVWRFIKEIKTKKWVPGGWYPRFHQAIQWFEKPMGLLVELIWLSGMSVIFSKLVT